ncbi:N-acetylglutaminylglutamine synthetase [Desulfobulbus alkaliphilus]|uniref:N-acetylglutaminylglutamine synthetase n=1 Tax=Desulfobulbus alkaliphilus TaxID=869814 RepID=UPI001F065512|nr:N-acetylglutaminylglutamine synthetase [Desulfobulbus alkaliphilus]
MTSNDTGDCGNPMDPSCMASLKHWGKPLFKNTSTRMEKEVSVDCGWGRLIFGQTFTSPEQLARMIRREQRGRRDIAIYMRDPHVVISYAPQELFLDPSLAYRLDFQNYRLPPGVPGGPLVRPLGAGDDAAALNRIYLARGMVPCYDGFYTKTLEDPALIVLVALDPDSGAIVGAVTGVDHHQAFRDPDNGSSLWALAVDQQSQIPGIGEALVRELIMYFMEKGRSFLDLSVMHTNKEAIALYDKLGFEQVPVYSIKKKNLINEALFIGPDPEEELNIYARIITGEARRRGIGVEVLDAEHGYFELSLGGRSIACRESLCELTTAIAMSRCDDKVVTRKILEQAGMRVPAQAVAQSNEQVNAFLDRHQRVVVKPARGEQGAGVFVDLDQIDEVLAAVDKASTFCEKVILEEFVQGEDLRIIVIDYKVVAAAVRKPACIRGNGTMTVRELIERQSRRRAAATHGESVIPVDEETVRTIERQGFALDDRLPAGRGLRVRKTANLHTGGTIHDVTADVHPDLNQAAEAAAVALRIPVVGFDFLAPDIGRPEYVIIEANERPGLANHEPQPTAERFIDLLFPQTRYLAEIV